MYENSKILLEIVNREIGFRMIIQCQCFWIWQTFAANRDRNSVTTNSFMPYILARCIRVHPSGWHSRIALRMELYGCPVGKFRSFLSLPFLFPFLETVAYIIIYYFFKNRINLKQSWSFVWCFSIPADKCQLPLGVENKEVPNPRMRASSYRYSSCGPYNGRLNQPYAWCSKYRRQGEWLAIDFGAMTKMTGIATQGRRNANEWIESYYLSFSRKGVHWTIYKERRKTKVERSNTKNAFIENCCPTAFY